MLPTAFFIIRIEIKKWRKRSVKNSRSVFK